MKKNQAIKLMQEGKKLTHRYFTCDEWVSINNLGQVVFENGDRCTYQFFWKDRSHEGWEDSWELFEGN